MKICMSAIPLQIPYPHPERINLPAPSLIFGRAASICRHMWTSEFKPPALCAAQLFMASTSVTAASTTRCQLQSRPSPRRAKGFGGVFDEQFVEIEWAVEVVVCRRESRGV